MDLRSLELWTDLSPNRKSFIMSTKREIYDRLKKSYTRRMTSGEDTDKAFSGVIQAFDTQEMSETRHRFYATHFYRLPAFSNESNGPIATTTLTYSLCWFIERGNGYWHRPPSWATSHYPSWSWGRVKANQPQLDTGRLNIPTWKSPVLPMPEDVHLIDGKKKLERWQLQKFATNHDVPLKIGLNSYARSCHPISVQY
jgi:hypothetical protein